MDTLLHIWSGFSNAEKVYVICTLAYFPLLIIGICASVSVNRTFDKYSRIAIATGHSAMQVARGMLDNAGLQHVQIQQVAGKLTDHYDPRTQTVSLSASVYGSRSVSAVSVACHECGHAIQHANGFVFSAVRLALVPVVNIANKILFPLIMIGFFLQFFIYAYSQFAIFFLMAGAILFGISMIFSLITLPTEFDASRRASEYFKEFMLPSEVSICKKVLNAAAMTYLVAFLMSLVQFLRYVAIILMRSNRR